ncbi:MAG: GGDEF domain-containing protein [Microcoleaceae cyanobacterium MO_207.B10]|nr:GGDEF domain-containing protein [Microcoleaceae cyanobacterium MO_207.B10]
MPEIKEEKQGLNFFSTIKFRMFLVFFITIGVLLLVTTSSVIVMQALEYTIDQFIEGDLLRVEKVRKLDLIVKEIASDVQTLSESRTKYSLNQNYKKIDKLLVELEDTGNNLSINGVDADIVQILLLAQKIRSETQLSFQLMASSLEIESERLPLKTQLFETSIKISSELQTTANQLVKLSHGYTQGILDDFEEDKNAVFAVKRYAMLSIIAISLIAIAIITLVQWKIVERGFSRRLEIISKSLARVPKTSEQTHIHVTGNDEIALMARRLESLLEKALQIQLMASTDELTQVANRRHFFETVEIETKRAMRSGEVATVLVLDIDFFKNINDTYGHDVGDLVLQKVSYSLKECLRTTDILARMGGEEFAIFCPETKLENGKVLAERIRQTIENLKVELFDGTRIKVTISIGVATFFPSSMDINKVLKNADSALYVAKKEGRNRVVVNNE